MGTTLSVPNTNHNLISKSNELFKCHLDAIQGYRNEMEDSHIIELDIPDLPGWAFFAIFDGHAGDETAKYAAKYLLKIVVDRIKNLVKEENGTEINIKIEEALSDAFIEFDDKNKSPYMINTNSSPESNKINNNSGSTATCVLVSPTEFYFINLGDSRTVLYSGPNIIFETSDHKPENKEEKLRIELAGGFVQNNRVRGMLAVSRAFGDYCYKDEPHDPKNLMVSPVPTINVVKRDPSQTMIFLACDGVWDVLNSQVIGNHFEMQRKDDPDLSLFLNRIISSSISLGSRDNISTLAVFIKNNKFQKMPKDNIDKYELLFSKTKELLYKMAEEKFKSSNIHSKTDLIQIVSSCIKEFDEFIYNSLLDETNNTFKKTEILNPESLSLIRHSIHLDLYEYLQTLDKLENSKSKTEEDQSQKTESESFNDFPAINTSIQKNKILDKEVKVEQKPAQ